MKLIAINGSPRKSCNTSTLLQHAMEGATSQGFETELIHLYDLNFKGCISCFACKVKDGKSYGKCAINDELTPVLEKIESVDALILGSPNYIGAPTSMMKAFIERLVYPYIVYGVNFSSLFKNKITTGFIYTMSSNENWMMQMGYDQSSIFIENILKMFFGSSQSLIVNDTYMFEDYSKYVFRRFDPIEKAKKQDEQFPKDCKKAFDMGVELTNNNIC